MPEFVCKLADAQGQVRQQVETWDSEKELRRDYTERGLLLYSVKLRRSLTMDSVGGRGSRLNLEQFVIFNQQFVTLTRAGLPILRSLELLAENHEASSLGGSDQRRPRASDDRNAFVRGLSSTRCVSADLHDFVDGWRKER